ncbi:maltokinase N-terminal cap-like domain-containing protein [Streptosporangium sandarakinum]
MAKIQPGATLTPHFRDFLPAWVAQQPWYPGDRVPSLSPVGYFRFEDPAGEVGIETHLVTDGSVLYQIPMTYRGAPLAGADQALITTAEHSVLGTRWIYDGEKDPIWAGEVLRLIGTEGGSESSSRRGGGEAQARGRRLAQGELTSSAVTIELRRILTAGDPPSDPEIIGLMMGTWYPGGPDAATATGCLATIRSRRHSS